MLWRIVYISSATKAELGDEGERILSSARKRNAERAITGLLVYSGGSFLQVLEGAKDTVEEIFAAIRRDHRHRSIIQLLSEEIQERDFKGWDMAWLDLPDGHPLAARVATDLHQLDTARPGGASAEVNILLHTFADIVNSGGMAKL